MNREYFRTLYEYNYWDRDRILAAAEGMTDEEYQKPNGFTYDGLHAILAHAMAAENVWFTRLRGEEFTGLIPEGEIATLATLKPRWEEEESRFWRYFETLTDERIAADFVFQRRTGEEVRTPLWLLLAHLANHGTQHRSEAAEALTMAGRSPGSLDLTTFVWEQRPI